MNMNKLFTKIAGAVLGLTMAIGVGVGIANNNKEAVPVRATGESEYQLIKSTDDLTSGCNYVIGATHNGSGSSLDYFISKESNGNNRKTTTATVTSEKLTFNSNILNVTLGGDSTNGWTFRTTNYDTGAANKQGFLDATSTTSNNYLKVTTGDSAGNYAKFSISITNAGVATITCNGKTSRHIMYFNYNSGSPMFSCYNSQTTAPYAKVKIYKEIVPVTGLSLSDGTGTYTSNTALNLYENVAFNLTATVTPTNASDSTVSWSSTGNISGSNGSYTIGAYATSTSASITCETNGKNGSGNKISITLTITILQDSRSIDGIVVEGLDYTGVTFYNGHSSWDLDGVIYKAHFNNDTTEIITGDDLDNVAVAWSAPYTGLTSVYLYVLYGGDYGNADGGLTLDGFTTVASEATYTRTAPTKTIFTTDNTFTYGGTITETWNYDTEHPNTYHQDDDEISFELQNQDGTKVTDLVPDTTSMLTNYSGKYVSVKFNGTQVQNRYSITVNEAFNKNVGEYHLITNPSSLYEGAHITIAAFTSDVVMNATASNNVTGFKATAQVAVKDATTNTINKTKALDLELVNGAVSGSYALKLETGNYLYAEAGNNRLKNKAFDALDKTASFVFTCSNGEWSITCQNDASGARNVMQYNPNNGNPIFACYASADAEKYENMSVYLFKTYSQEASEYAETFIKGSGNAGTCAATKSAWSTLATSYGQLTDGCKNLFEEEEHQDSKNFDGSTEYSVTHAVARYDQVLIANGTSSYNDFIGRTAPGGKLPLSRVSSIFENQNNSIITIIIIISMISITAFAGYMVLRKRKEQ